MAKLLDRIDRPEQLKCMSPERLEQLAEEIRELILHTVAANGGHLAPSLGVVELTLALHSIFHCPQDKMIWDVGHQAYVHKILTGRRERFSTLRKKGGITGFPKREESEYDAFGAGHASTSISAAVGMALARDLNGEKYHVVAILGDGAFTGGEIFEALNHAGSLGRNLIIVLNDNERSIDKNVGALSEYFSRINILPHYQQTKQGMENLLKKIPHIGEKMLSAAGNLKDGVKSVLTPGGLFEELGLHYIGPLDGHDIPLLQKVFSQVKRMDGPILVHVCTKKGKGYLPAERNPGTFHGIGKFDLETGKAIKQQGGPPTYTEVFSKTLVDLAEKNEDIVAITAAMPSGTGLSAFGKKFPERFFDVGIAEEHAVTMAAGLAAGGKRPVVALYSTFAQRGYDQLLHDVCLQKLPVVLCLDRAGLVGEDGPTHHGVFDLSYLRHMPGMTVLAPKDEAELRQMLAFAVSHDGPISIRYPRGAGLGTPMEEVFSPMPLGKAEILKESGPIGMLAIGSMVDTACRTGSLLKERGLEAAVANMRFVKPLDAELLRRWSEEKALLVTLEENVLAGGFGSSVLEFLAEENLSVPVMRVGIGDSFVEQGTRQELLALCGMTAEQITGKIAERYEVIADKGE